MDDQQIQHPHSFLSLLSDGALVWKDHPKVTPLDGYTERIYLCKAAVGYGI